MTASANSPVPKHYLTINLTDLPENAVYADLLIKIDQNDSKYVDFQHSAYGNDKNQINIFENDII